MKFFDTLRQATGLAAVRASNRPGRGRRAAPEVDALEPRQLMSEWGCEFRIGPANEFYPGGTISILGSPHDDNVEIRVDDRGTASAADDQVVIRAFTTLGALRIGRFPAEPAPFIFFHGNDGSDNFESLTRLSIEARGEGGNDRINLPYGADGCLLDGGAGNDTIRFGDLDAAFGYHLNSEAHGTLIGGPGNDRLKLTKLMAPSSWTAATEMTS